MVNSFDIEITPSLPFEKNEINMSLTTAGLLPDRTKKLVQLYSRLNDPETVKKKWHKKRIGKRGSRSSSQKIFSILMSRLEVQERILPSPKRLGSLLDKCSGSQEKAQALYLYVLEDDELVKYVTSAVVEQTELGEFFDFSMDNIKSILGQVRYRNGEKLNYSESTIEKWIRNYRSLMRKIGVIGSKTGTKGESPNLGDISLNISSLYSYNIIGDNWLDKPAGWLFLYQNRNYWESLIKRVSEFQEWNLYEVKSQRKLKPNDKILEQMC